MTSRTYRVFTAFSGSAGKTLGVLRARGAEFGGARSRFVSCGAIDIDPEACADFELLTGAKATAGDLGEMGPEDLAQISSECPDLFIMSPPCKGWSSCLPEATASTAKYRALNDLALHTINLMLEAWSPELPAVLLMENVPRMLSRGKRVLEHAKSLLRAKGYEVDLREHDCGVLGGLAQSRKRVLLVARLPSRCPTPLLMPQPRPLRSMASVLWQLPVPTPGSTEGGPMHRLPRLAPLNWLRLAAIRAGNDWRDLPAEIRLPSDSRRHAGKYGVQDPSDHAHTVLGETRTGKGWADVADPRVSDRRRGGYGVQAPADPSFVIRGRHGVWEAPGSIAEPRLSTRAARQNGGFGVNDPAMAAHSVLAEGSVRNTFASTADPRLGCAPRNGAMGVCDPARASGVVLASADIHAAAAAVADPRSDCRRREGALGVCSSGDPLYTAIIANTEVHNGPWQIADARVLEQRRGNYGVQDSSRPAQTVRGRHCVRTAPASVADGRGFCPSHRLLAAQPLDVTREAWVEGEFQLLGPEVVFDRKGKPVHLIIQAPDGTVHRPLTTLELAVLQGFPAWHRPGDPAELAREAPGGQWLELTGRSDGRWRERIGNAVPPPTAQAFAEQVLRILDAGAEHVFELSTGGVWVERAEVAATL